MPRERLGAHALSGQLGYKFGKLSKMQESLVAFPKGQRGLGRAREDSVRRGHAVERRRKTQRVRGPLKGRQGGRRIAAVVQQILSFQSPERGRPTHGDLLQDRTSQGASFRPVSLFLKASNGVHRVDDADALPDAGKQL